MNSCIVAAAQHISLPVEVPKHLAAKLRRSDDFIRLGVAAAGKALPEAVAANDIRTGLFVGTAFGPMQTNFDVLGLIVDENQTSPTLFSHSVFNSAAGYIARLFDITGSCFTFTDFSWPFFRALDEGYRAIVSGRINRCLVLQVESYSDLLLDARRRTGTDSDEWQPGAVAWYLTAGKTAAGWQLEKIGITSHPSRPEDLLHRREELRCSGECMLCTNPLASAASVTRLIQKTDSRELTFSLTAPYGSVSLTFTAPTA